MCGVSYQAPGSAGTFCHADASDADQKVAEMRSRRRLKHHLSAELQAKFPDFPVMESKRDRLKQREKSQPYKKTAAEVVEKPKLSCSKTVDSELERTDSTVEQMDV